VLCSSYIEGEHFLFSSGYVLTTCEPWSIFQTTLTEVRQVKFSDHNSTIKSFVAALDTAGSKYEQGRVLFGHKVVFDLRLRS